MRIKLTADKVQLFSYFFGISVLGSILLSMPCVYDSGIPVPYLDALFTSVSAVCVTGLSTLDMNVYSHVGFYVIMGLIELGGLGLISFIALYLAAPKKKVSLINRTIIREFFIEDVEYDPKRILGSIIAFTLCIEIISSLILFFLFKRDGSTQPVLDGMFHAISAFCNAGFSTYDDSLSSFRSDTLLLSVIMTLIVTGGIGFIVLSDVSALLFGRRRRLSHHSILALLFSVTLILFGTLVFYLLERHHGFNGFPVKEKIFSSLFQSITPRTAGFSIVNQSNFSPTTKLVTVLFMFIGGSPGSIAGGVKTTTFLVVLLYALRGNPEHKGVNVLGRNITTAVIEKAFSIIAKSLMILVVSVTLLSLTEKASMTSGAFSIFDIMYESVSAFGTVGLSMGITASLTDLGKIVIILTMFIGRTGIVAMALGFIRSEKERWFEYPSANIMVG